MSQRQAILQGLLRAGLPQLSRAWWGRQSLTVLAYHRLANPFTPEFDTFVPNVSATPAAFAAQMDFVRQRFQLVSLPQVVDWLHHGAPLPPHAALITFDDGYRDNYTHALPILQARQLPAVIFLASDYIDQQRPFFWDLAAYCFYHTAQEAVRLPHRGEQSWANAIERTAVMLPWLEQIKQLPDEQKWTAVNQLPTLLNVAIPDDAFAGLHLTWDEVRTMQARNITLGAHTQSHPILSRLTLAQAQREIVGCKSHIEAETGQPVTSFAYPNGQPSDFAPIHQQLLRQAGFSLAFTLQPTPARQSELRHAPYAIRRTLIDYRDSLPRFAAKVLGLTRLLGIPR